MGDGENFAAQQPHVPMPVALLLDPDLSDAAKILWALLYQYSVTGGGEAFEMSQDEMATLAGAATGSIRKRRDELVGAGWLEVVVLPGLARKQHLTVRIPGEHAPIRPAQ